MKLSIITINYNNRDGLQKTIDSVIAQTWRDFEWIIIDGGSTDGSKELITNLHDNTNANLSYWCSELDKGVYNAMNKGIEKAKGEYLNFMNSGDCYASEEVLNKVFRDTPTEDILYGNAIIDNGGRKQRITSFHSNYIYGDDLVRATINHQSSFIRKELFDKYGLYDETLKIASDWKFFFEVILIHQCVVKYLDFSVAIYDDTGISSTQKSLHTEERIKVLREYIPDFVMRDYLAAYKVNEVLKYKYSRFVFRVLYKMVMLYEKKKKYIRL